MRKEGQTSEIPTYCGDLNEDIYNEIILDSGIEDASKDIRKRLSSILSKFSKEGKWIESDWEVVEEHRRKPTEVLKLCYGLSDEIFPLAGLHLNDSESETVWKLANILLEFRDKGRRV